MLDGAPAHIRKQILETHRDLGELVCACDTNAERLDLVQASARRVRQPALKLYSGADFDKMISENKPDVVFPGDDCVPLPWAPSAIRGAISYAGLRRGKT